MSVSYETPALALAAAVMWLELLCEAADIDPEDTRINANVHNLDGDKKRVATVTLDECIVQFKRHLPRAA